MNYAAMRYVADECQVRGAGRAILHVIAYRADRVTGDAYASVRSLAASAGIARSTVEEWLPRLIDDGHLAVVLEGSGRRSTCYRVIGHLDCSVPATGTHSPVDNSSSVPAVGTDTRPVVSRSTDASVPIQPSVVSRYTGSLYKEGREELEGKNGRVEPAAPPPPSPSGAAVAADEQDRDPRELIAEAVLAIDPGAIQDADGWNLSDRFSRAWLPNEDAAKWLRHQHAQRQAVSQ